MIKIIILLQKNWAKIFTTIKKNPVTLCLAGMETVKKGQSCEKSLWHTTFFRRRLLKVKGFFFYYGFSLFPRKKLKLSKQICHCHVFPNKIWTLTDSATYFCTVPFPSCSLERSYNQGPFKYYVSKEVGGWGQKMAFFADLQQVGLKKPKTC